MADADSRAGRSARGAAASVLAGLAAGVGICFKPHFLAVPVLVELYARVRRRSLRPVLTLKNLVIVLTGLAYVAATWLFVRPYLAEVVPLISQVYWGFSRSMLQVVLSQPPAHSPLSLGADGGARARTPRCGDGDCAGSGGLSGGGAGAGEGLQNPALVLIDAREYRHAIGTLPMDFEAFYTEDPPLRGSGRVIKKSPPVCQAYGPSS